MTHRLCLIALACVAFGVPADAMTRAELEGKWTNPKHSTVVNVTRCGEGTEYCAVVVEASEKTKENAAKGGTTSFVGTEILRVHAVGDDEFGGTAFDPESNLHVAATVHLLGPGVMEMKGCAMMGLVCQTQRWTKIESSRRSQHRSKVRGG